MVDELHAVVRLLLKRMESHPEEFMRLTYRWEMSVEGIRDYGNDADKAAVNEKLREIRLGEIHERVMDELFNGEERRQKDKLFSEEQQKRHIAASAAQAKQRTLQDIYNPGLAGQMNQSLSQSLATVTTTANNSMTLGGETLTESMLQQIRKVLGAK